MRIAVGIASVVFVIACSGSTPSPEMPSALSRNDAVLATVYLHELATAKLDATTNVCLTVRGEVTDFAAVLGVVRQRYPKAVPDAAGRAGRSCSSPVATRCASTSDRSPG